MPAIPHVDRLKTIYTAAKHLNFGFRMTGYPTAPQYNGWSGRAIPQCHRITIRFCRKDSSSAGVREFISKELVNFAKENPATAIYVIPARQVIPTFRGEYANGREVHLNAKNFSLVLVIMISFHSFSDSIKSASTSMICAIEVGSLSSNFYPLKHRR
jgi:large subunit ribosomal protein L43